MVKAAMTLKFLTPDKSLQIRVATHLGKTPLFSIRTVTKQRVGIQMKTGLTI